MWPARPRCARCSRRPAFPWHSRNHSRLLHLLTGCLDTGCHSRPMVLPNLFATCFATDSAFPQTLGWSFIMLKRMTVDLDGSLRNCARRAKMAGMLALVLLAASCRKPQATEIPGPYNRDRTQGKEWLDLKPDGNHFQVYLKTTSVRSHIGQWAFKQQPPT